MFIAFEIVDLAGINFSHFVITCVIYSIMSQLI